MNYEEFVDIFGDDERLKYSIHYNRVVIAKRMKERQFEKIWKFFRDKNGFYLTTAYYPLD